jgi:hypothetical protein
MSNKGLIWGDWNAWCEVCGFKFKASKLRKRWDGLMVCNDDWEHRHPQDLIKVPKDDQTVPWAAPEPADEFITVDYVGAGTGVQDNTVPEGDFDNNNEAL